MDFWQDSIPVETVSNECQAVFAKVDFATFEIDFPFLFRVLTWTEFDSAIDGI